jgi:hypothetical protein
MKLTRSTYPMLLGIIIFMVIKEMIGTFSEELEEQIFLPTLIIFIILLIIGIVIAYIDKELFHAVTDERTKRVDRSAVYYSWWFTLIFALILGFIARIYSFTLIQYIFVLYSEAFLIMLIFHMYFNIKGVSKEI